MNIPRPTPDADQPNEGWLRIYATTRCEQAFANLVEVYGGMVYASALRRTGDPQMAEDISQEVFTLVAQKASQLHKHPSLAGWLFVTTRRRAQEALRSERRKAARLKRLQAMTTQEAPNTVLDETKPMLDEALDSLKRIDRDILLWHYVEEQPYEEIAQRLGRSAAACRKRASRALEKLSAVLEKRGLAVPAVALGNALTAQFGDAAPTEIGSTLLKLSALEAPSAITFTSVQTATGITLMKLKSIAWTACLALLPIALPWLAGVGLSVGALYLSGPAVHSGPESIVMDLAENKTTRTNNAHQAAVDAAYEKLFAQAISAKGPEATKRVMDVGLALYEAEPEGLWRMMDRAPLSAAKKLYGLANFARHGAVGTLEALERGYLVDDPETYEAAGSLIYLAQREDPKGFIHWLGKLSEETEFTSPYLLGTFSPDLLKSLPANLQKRYLEMIERTYSVKADGEHPLEIDDLWPVLKSLRQTDHQLTERMMRSLLPSLPKLTDESFSFLQTYLKRYLPESEPIASMIDLSTSRGEALHNTITKDTTPSSSALRELAQSDDLLTAINAVLRDRTPNKPNHLSRFDHQLASAILQESANPGEVFAQLNEVDPAWRDVIAKRMVGLWASHDVVAASAALAQAPSVPDSAIVALVKEIAHDSDGARAWATQIQDKGLRLETLSEIP